MPTRKTKQDADSTTPSTAAKKPAAKKPAAKKTTAARSTAAGKKSTTGSRTTTARARSSSSGAERETGFGSGKSLVIVESPAKAKTLQKYLGKDFRIEASVGHVKDLPTSKIGVDVEHGFEPHYEVLKGKEKVLERIRKSAAAASEIYLAPDPDREGEAIAWHIADEIRGAVGTDKKIYRATFNEITKRAVQEAIEHPRELNLHLFEAQQARRILDRLVGYKISPLLWAKVTRGLSAGRVQSVAVRLVVEREREIDGFNPEEYWSVEAQVAAQTPPPFEMRLTQIDGKKPQLASAGEAQAILEAIGASGIEERSLSGGDGAGRGPERKMLAASIGEPWTVSSVEKKDVRRHPAPPFITSTLQQEASRKLGFGAKRTMTVAQRLYEGLELGELGHTALITYMRTDSTRISNDAIGAARAFVEQTYGSSYVPETPNSYRSKKGAQDAHEAIRPTDMNLVPEKVAPFLEPDQVRLYTLIWNRFVASQMADAIFEQTKVESVPRDGYVFTATGLVQKFAGYLAVYEEGHDDVAAPGAQENADGAEAGSDGKAPKLPALRVGDSLDVGSIRAAQHFTQPPPRYTEASLVKELEKRGIGRPSTYATIVSVIQEKDYVAKDDAKRFRPTELGYVVTDLLVENFPEVLDVSFTARMEEGLDSVEEGVQDWRHLLGDFYGGFQQRLEAAALNMKSVKREEIPTDIECDKCHEAKMVVKWGRSGRFLACPRYPECKNTREYVSKEGGEIAPVEVVYADEHCDACGKQMVVKNGRAGRFLACPGYPDCKSVKPFKTGVKCPECGTGDLVERMSKRGKMFFSCSNYPNCQHVEWNRPVPQPCPQCGSSYMTQRDGKKRMLICPNSDCKHTEALPEEQEELQEKVAG